MRIVHETDWHAERVRQKAIRLLRYLPERNIVRRKRILGRGKVLSPIPFNVLEGIGVALRSDLIRGFVFRVGMVPVIMGWSLGSICVRIGIWILMLMRKIWAKIMDELDDDDSVGFDDDSEADSDDGLNSLDRLQG
jgi:hypothetical protein